MTSIKNNDSGIIKVADVTIAQLSRGLYRSTATAFKELVSNAYDADATEVRIDTNYPEFDFISCIDNGNGMPIVQFLNYFQDKGIGSGIKRKGNIDRTKKFNRPIIGRLGIGMLAIGQICHSFEIESHYEEKNNEYKAYKATIVLEDIEKIPDKEKIIRNNDSNIKELDVGIWKYEFINYDKKKKGFRIHSVDVRETFRREMKSSISDKKEQSKMSFSLSKLHKEFYDKSKKSIRDCKPYLETIWELSTLSPIPYYNMAENKQKTNKYPIDFSLFNSNEVHLNEFKKTKDFIIKRQNQLINEKFIVIFDGIEIKRHIQLPTEDNIIPKVYFIEFDDIVYDNRLKFEGYIFAQVPKAIRPPELNGIQIRLRGVGIGGYDSTYLKYYRKIESIRSRWVSGEIFVDIGLESALNIDRDSFNEHDEHFKKLQTIVHDKIDKIFDEIRNMSIEQSEYKRSKKEKEINIHITSIVSQESKGKFKLIQKNLEGNQSPVFVNEKNGEIILNMSYQPLKKKKADMLIRMVELAYQISKHVNIPDKNRDELFLNIIKDIFRELL